MVATDTREERRVVAPDSEETGSVAESRQDVRLWLPGVGRVTSQEDLTGVGNSEIWIENGENYL